MNKFLAGLLAGLPLALLLAVYMLMRGQALIQSLTAQGDLGGLSEKWLSHFVLASFVGMGLVLGIAAGLVYGWVGSPEVFRLLALGLAILLSVLAVLSRTPLPADKVFVNFAVAGVLGWLVPLLASG